MHPVQFIEPGDGLINPSPLEGAMIEIYDKKGFIRLLQDVRKARLADWLSAG